MWKVDLTYRKDLNNTFERLFEKKAMLEKARPLPNILCKK